MTKTALVIHPYLSVYAGGEVVCLHVINALLKDGYKVSLFSNKAVVEDANKFYPEIGWVLSHVDHVKMDVSQRRTLLPGMRMLDTTREERRIYRTFDGSDYDFVISTQSSIFTAENARKLVHFTYDFTDLFVFSPFTRMKDWKPDLEGLRLRSFKAYTEGRRLTRIMTRKIFGIGTPQPNLIATPSSILLNLLKEKGYSNTTSFVPPARSYTPLPKKRQIVQIARIVQAKRIELYFEAARRLPREHFILIARYQEGADLYGQKLMKNVPSNVEFIEGNLRDHVDRLRESSVYCYTGRDRAIMLTVAEGISAGCYPIVAADSSALDVEGIAKVGSSFSTVNDLVQKLKYELDHPKDPWKIHQYAEPFKPEHFERWVQTIAQPS